MEKRRIKKSAKLIENLEMGEIENLLKWVKTKESDRILNIILEQNKKINEIIDIINKEGL